VSVEKVPVDACGQEGLFQRVPNRRSKAQGMEQLGQIPLIGNTTRNVDVTLPASTPI
jgi:hypothetical protein